MQERHSYSPVLALVATSLSLLLIATGCSARTAPIEESNGGANGEFGDPPAVLDLPDGSGAQEGSTNAVTVAPTTNALRIAFVSAMAVDPVDADPVNPAHLQMLDLLYVTLPDISESIEMSSDGLSWTFTLGAGHRFTDTKPITASDVVRSIDRLVAMPESLASLRLSNATFQAVDDLTVRVDLVDPEPSLGAILANPVFAIVPDRALTGAVGSGAYVLVGSSLIATTDAAVPTIELVAVDDDPDLAFGPGDGLTERHTAGHVEVYYGLNVNSWKLSDPSRRELVAHAVNQAYVLQDLAVEDGARDLPAIEDLAATPINRLGDRGDGCGDCGSSIETTTTTLPELFVDYVVQDGLWDGGVAPSEASQLDPGGLFERRVAEEIAAQLRRAGVPAQARGHSLTDFVELVTRGEHEIYRTGWIGFADDPNARLSPYISTDVNNVSGYANATFDTAMTKARAAEAAPLDPAQDPFGAAQQILIDDAVVLPIMRLDTVIWVGDRLIDVELEPDGTIDVEQLELS